MPSVLRSLLLVGFGVTGFIAVFLELTVAPSWRTIFWELIAVHDRPALWLMSGLMLTALIPLNSLRSEALIKAINRQRYLIAGVLWITLVLASRFIYHGHPLSMDEYAAVFQAKIFAAGKMHGHFPPELMNYLVPKFFQNYFLAVNGTTGAVSSAYWPGFSLLLAPFVWIGAPWACNPTIVALSLLLIRRLTAELTDDSQAPGWAILFALASPAFVANGIAFYSMPAHLLLNLAFAWLMLGSSLACFGLAGVIGGFALTLHNPFPHMVFALPWLLHTVFWRRPGMGRVVALVSGYLVAFGLFGIGWSLWRHHMLAQGSVAAIAASAATGLAPPAPGGFADRLLKAVASFVPHFPLPNENALIARVAGLSKLWLWASPLLLVLAWLGARTAANNGVRLFAASAITTAFAYFLVPFDQGHGWGYRYFHSAWGALPILASLWMARPEARSIASRLVVMTLLSLLLANGMRIWQIGDFIAGHLAQMPPTSISPCEIVVHNGRGYYANDLIQNDPWLRNGRWLLLNPPATPTLPAEALVQQLLPGNYVAKSNRYGTTFICHGTPGAALPRDSQPAPPDQNGETRNR